MLNWRNPESWNILIVDDEPDNVEVVAESLKFLGATVRTAANGQEGLKVLEHFTPNLVLLDLSMPVMDGWEMRKRVKDDPRWQDIPIMALSAHAMRGDKIRALEVGFDGYITKPVSVPTLAEDIRAAFQQGQSELQAQQPVTAPDHGTKEAER
ncbi:MAG: response regulator [Anaerolineae bacterium]|nr:response regulator [Anaerolineae bacterium]